MAGDPTPAPSTLHAWLDGLGAYALGRQAGEVPGAMPASAVVAEVERRFGPGRPEESEIDPRRYRSRARHDRLHAARDLLASLAPIGRSVLASANLLIARNGLPGSLTFRTGLKRTAIEQPGVEVSAKSFPPVAKEETTTCQTRGRSPPGDSK